MEYITNQRGYNQVMDLIVSVNIFNKTLTITCHRNNCTLIPVHRTDLKEF